MSIQSLADSLSLSISTVSRALNGYADVSLKTRERVIAAAKAMNYSPHPAAHRLATGKTGVVAVISSTRPNGVADNTTTALYSGIERYMREQNYFTMSLSIPTGEGELPELQRLLSARLFDGVVLTRTRTHDERVSLLQERQLPFVTYGRTLENTPHAYIDTDNQAVFERATQLLIDHGHRRIAFINALPHMTFASLRDIGFRKAIASAGLDENLCPVHYTELTSQAGAHVTEQLLALAHPPSAILCATDNMAVGAIRVIRQAGLRVGQDISVMGYGNSEMGQNMDPPLATIETSMLAHGRQAAEFLLQLIQGRAQSSMQRVDMPVLLPKASLGRYQG